jgi:hypothetical protein
MLLGLQIQPQMMILGGAFLGIMIVFQVLQGLRVIHFKGRLHMKMHKAVAYLIVAGGLFHGAAGLAYFGNL